MKIPKALIPSRTRHVWQRPASCDPTCGCVRRVCRLCGVEGHAERTVEGLLSEWVRSTNGRTRMLDCPKAAEAVAAIVATIAEELTTATGVVACAPPTRGFCCFVKAPGREPKAACQKIHRAEAGARKCAEKTARCDDRARLKRDRHTIKARILATITGDVAPKAAP